MAHSGSSAAPVMSQKLSAFDTTKPYSLSFYYDLYEIPSGSSCTLAVTLGDVNIYTKVLTTADDPRAQNWKGPITTTPVIPSSHEETLSVEYKCTQSNIESYIFFDDFSLQSV